MEKQKKCIKTRIVTQKCNYVSIEVCRRTDSDVGEENETKFNDGKKTSFYLQR